MEIAKKLAALEPENTTFLRDLSVSYERLGDLDSSLDAVRARGLYQQSLEIRKKLAAREPENRTFLRDLYVSHWQLGSASLPEWPEAGLRELTEGFGIAERCAMLDGGNPQLRQDLAEYFDTFEKQRALLSPELANFVRERQEFWSGR
jgi:hypothetical protein